MAENSNPPDTVCRRHELLETMLARIEKTTREGFAGVNKSLGEVAKDLRDGAVNMGRMQERIAHLERWVFGAMSAGLAGLAMALLALALKS